MNTLSEIGEYLKKNDNYVIIPHRNPDGDCLGCVSALTLALRQLGKNARIALPNPVTKRHLFMWDESFCNGDFPAETAISADVAAPDMMGELYESLYCKAAYRICLDHHGTNTGFGDYNYIDGSAAAAGEIIYDLLKIMQVDINAEIAEKLFVAIVDDTGSFQYSNTTADTHFKAAALYQTGIHAASIMKKLFDTHTMEEIKLMNSVVSGMEFYADNKICTTFVNQDILNSCGASFDQADAWVSLPRSVDTVEVGILFKIRGEREVKASLRSNEYVDVSAVAKKFGGGGHMRAAGVTFTEPYETAKKLLLEELEKLV